MGAQRVEGVREELVTYTSCASAAAPAFPAHPARAGWLMKGNFNCTNLRATRDGVESAVDGFVLLLWRASWPRLGSGLAGLGPGCLWCFSHFYLQTSCCLIAAVTRQRYWVAHMKVLKCSHVRIFWCPFKNSLLASYTPSLNFQPLFLLWWHWCRVSILPLFPSPLSLPPTCG